MWAADDLFAIAKFLLTIGRLLLHCWYSLGRHVTTGTPMVIFCAVLAVFWLFYDWYTVGTVLVDLWRLVHQWSFLLFWLFSVHCWYTIGTFLVDMLRLVHQWSFLCCFDCVLAVFDFFWYSCDVRTTRRQWFRTGSGRHWLWWMLLLLIYCTVL